MAYLKRKRNVANRSSKKRRTTRPKKTSIKKIVSRLIAKKTETKFLITSSTESAVNTLTSPATTNSIVLNNVGQGSNVYQRVGSVISSKYLNIRGVITNATLTPMVTKIVVLACNQNDIPTDDLCESNSALFAPASADLSSIYARLNTTKYQILKTAHLMHGGNAGWQNAKFFNWNINLRGMKIKFDQGATLPEKKIIIIYWTRRLDNDDSLGNDTEITWNSKYYYTDM